MPVIDSIKVLCPLTIALTRYARYRMEGIFNEDEYKLNCQVPISL